MGNIVLLDDNTINKIAAGEVIERPASVVKELMENSIDAGATAISVEIRSGGISYIRITDNGKGIAPDDMEIAFERHATSKIRKAEDLETVTSMGFRGEALASIAAISKVEMVSKTKENEIGFRIRVEGGNILEKEETGCSQGTTITITDLFFNTPVRYKFLKKDFTEAGYIEDNVTRLALVHPEIAIKLVNSGKTILQTPGNGDSKAVIYSIYGKDIAENILEVNYEYEDITVSGVIGKPIIARSNRSNQLFFVNKRYIKDKTLTGAAEQGYKGLLTIGKYGFLVLNLTMSQQKVDVNVHPAKLEVRFEEENKVFKAVYHAIRDTLLKSDLVGEPEKLEEKTKVASTETAFASTNPAEEIHYSSQIEKKEEGGLFKRFHKPQKEMQNDKNYANNFIAQIYSNRFEKQEDSKKEKEENKEQLSDETKVVNTEEVNQKLMDNIQELEHLKIEPETKDFNEMYTRTFGTAPSEVRRAEEEKKEELREEEEQYHFQPEDLSAVQNVSVFENEKTQTVPNYKYIGIAFLTYIIIELDNELYMIDQHAAHEKVLYEKIKANYYSGQEQNSQLMLLPDIIELSHKEMDIAKENMDMFRKAGFVVEEFGENTIKLSGVPDICIDLDTKELFLEALDEIDTVARTAKQEKEERFIATVACKSAVKANMALTKEEVDHLIKQLLVLENPFTCPHGRPTAIKMTKNDIERKFSRR